jgi:hypothetical protein
MLPSARGWVRKGNPHRLEAGIIGKASTRSILLLVERSGSGLIELLGGFPPALLFHLIHK